MENLVLAIIGSSSVATIITAIINAITKKKEGKSLDHALLIALTGMEIRKGCKQAIKDNGISYEELKQLQEMNALYKLNGGNGFVKVLMEKVAKLPIIDE